MAQGKPHTKFESNPSNNFRDGRTDGQTEDVRLTNFDFMSSADIVKQSQKWSGDIVKRYLSTEFGINLLDGFLQKEFYSQ